MHNDIGILGGRISERFRTLCFYLLELTGFFHLWSKLNKNSVIILMIHGVMDNSDGTLWTPLRPQLSRRHMERSLRLLSKYYTFVSLKEAVDMIEGNAPLIEKSILVTFDDGYKNNITHAMPILKSLNIPATIFPATGNIENRSCFWFDRLDYGFQNYKALGNNVVVYDQKRYDINSNNRIALRGVLKEIIFSIKSPERNDNEAMASAEKLITYFESTTGKKLNDIAESDPWCGLMTWEDLHSAVESGISVGSHTSDHARLGLLNSDEVRHQLKHSKSTLEQKLGISCDFFCYPNGSYNESVLDIVKETGYRAAITTDEGFNLVGDNVFKLKRMNFPTLGNEYETLAVACGFVFKLSCVYKRIKEIIHLNL
jgi:peptidoglycan/xylan/chitin deacetylase (PgdA/CDA1 family)